MATRGRPKLYTGKQAEKIVEMVKEFGALQTTQILRSRTNAGAIEKVVAGLRDQRVFPEALKISFPTVLRIAKDGGLVLSVGRRPHEDAPAVAETATA